MPPAAHAGAWTLAGGHRPGRRDRHREPGHQAFDSSGKLQSTPRYSKVELQALMEYGVTDWLTVDRGAGPAARRHRCAGRTPTAPASATPNSAPARASCRASNWVLSGQGTVRVPGTFDTGNPAAIGYTGVEVDLRGLFGCELCRLRHAGLRRRAARAALPHRRPAERDARRSDVRLAHRAAMAAAGAIVQRDLARRRRARCSRLRLSQAPAQRGLRTQRAMGAAGAACSPPIAGRNALQENGLVLGVWYRF